MSLLPIGSSELIQPKIRFDQVSHTFARGNHIVTAFEGLSMSVGPGELKAVQLVGDALGLARRATEESAVDLWR